MSNEQQILEERLRRAEQKAKDSELRALQMKINVGKEYLKMRELVGHSRFLDYLQEKGIDLQDALDCMRTALLAAINSAEGENGNE